jgi:ABC-type branched-subunit amino acid transport system ATPase component
VLVHCAYVLENGRVALESDSKDLLADERIEASYLGVS